MISQNNKLDFSPRIRVIQKIYGHLMNPDEQISYSKSQYKKFIKDVTEGTLERKDLIEDLIKKELKDDINENRTEIMVKLIIIAAVFEFMYMHKVPVKVVINEYLKAAEFFVQDGQKAFLNAILDKVSKVSRVIE